MIEIKSFGNKAGIAYLSDEIYEVTKDEFSFRKGAKVRLIGDEPQVNWLGYHEYSPENWFIVCPDGVEIAEYRGIPKTSVQEETS